MDEKYSLFRTDGSVDYVSKQVFDQSMNQRFSVKPVGIRKTNLRLGINQQAYLLAAKFALLRSLNNSAAAQIIELEMMWQQESEWDE